MPAKSRSLRPFLKLTSSLAPILVAAFMLLLPTSGAGQIRLHDAAKDDLARKTREAYDEFSKEDNTVFDKMINNTRVLKEATLTQLMELNRQTRRDTVNIIPVSTWKYLREKKVPDAQKDFLRAYNAARKLLDLSLTITPPVKSLKEAVDDAKTLLDKKKGDKEKKEKLIKADAAAVQDLAALKKSLDDLKDAAARSAKPIKNLSDLNAEFTNLKTVWSRITEVKDWFDAAEKARNAPGLQLTILDLGVQHQQFELERLKLQAEKAKAAEARLHRIHERLKMVWGDGATVKASFTDSDARTRTEELATKGLFGQIYRALTPVANADGKCDPDATAKDADQLECPFVTDEREQVLQTIGKLAARAEKEVGGARPDATMQLRDLMDVLNRYVTLVGYQKYLLLADTVEAAADENLFSIRLSAINTREREMLVAHGLEGLAAYHAGGIKPEEIANVFRAVQSIAVAALAAKE